ncbi:MAG: hypothetical protein WCI11_18535 [Candidatus Methylumidiphilus sp.]
MDKTDQRSLTPTKPQNLSTAAASLAGRGLVDLQKIQEWELKFPEDRVVGWIGVMGKSIPAQGIVRIPKGVSIGFKLGENEGDLSFFAGFPVDVPLYKLDLRGCEQISDKRLAYISCLPQLQELNFYGCNQITDEGLIHI